MLCTCAVAGSSDKQRVCPPLGRSGGFSLPPPPTHHGVDRRDYRSALCRLQELQLLEYESGETSPDDSDRSPPVKETNNQQRINSLDMHPDVVFEDAINSNDKDPAGCNSGSASLYECIGTDRCTPAAAQTAGAASADTTPGSCQSLPIFLPPYDPSHAKSTISPSSEGPSNTSDSRRCIDAPIDKSFLPDTTHADLSDALVLVDDTDRCAISNESQIYSYKRKSYHHVPNTTIFNKSKHVNENLIEGNICNAKSKSIRLDFDVDNLPDPNFKYNQTTDNENKLLQFPKSPSGFANKLPIQDSNDEVFDPAGNIRNNLCQLTIDRAFGACTGSCSADTQRSNIFQHCQRHVTDVPYIKTCISSVEDQQPRSFSDNFIKDFIASSSTIATNTNTQSFEEKQSVSFEFSETKHISQISHFAQEGDLRLNIEYDGIHLRAACPSHRSVDPQNDSSGPGKLLTTSNCIVSEQPTSKITSNDNNVLQSPHMPHQIDHRHTDEHAPQLTWESCVNCELPDLPRTVGMSLVDPRFVSNNPTGEVWQEHQYAHASFSSNICGHGSNMLELGRKGAIEAFERARFEIALQDGTSSFAQNEPAVILSYSTIEDCRIGSDCEFSMGHETDNGNNECRRRDSPVKATSPVWAADQHWEDRWLDDEDVDLATGELQAIAMSLAFSNAINFKIYPSTLVQPN